MKIKKNVYIFIIWFIILLIFFFFRECQINNKSNIKIKQTEKNELKSSKILNKDIINWTWYTINWSFIKINYDLLVNNKSNIEFLISDINKNISTQLNIDFVNISTKRIDFSFLQKINLNKVSDYSFVFDKYDDKYNVLFDSILNNKTFQKKWINSLDISILDIEKKWKLTNTIKKINFFSYKTLWIQYFSFNIRNYDIQYILTKEEFNLLANIEWLYTFSVDFYKPNYMSENYMFEFLKKLNSQISDFTIKWTDYKLIFNAITKWWNGEIIYKK